MRPFIVFRIKSKGTKPPAELVAVYSFSPISDRKIPRLADSAMFAEGNTKTPMTRKRSNNISKN